ncbi:hypothetical protein X943_000464 [Babesia divergens]|uniref:Rab GDP dissociation inhibitor n=1 Tax=Babesia divergens TaxID=32595 RepID=A0AAD9G6J5_BABDI|nr:hypothetical protein X943_000464 [Babesia divergens]
MADLHVDVVIAGTGIAATVLAAALARDDCQVLQIDRNHCYGQAHRTLSIKYLLQMHEASCLNRRECLQAQLEEYITQQRNAIDELRDLVPSTEAGELQEGQHATPTPEFVATKHTKVDRKMQRLREFMTMLLDTKDADPSVYYEVAPFAKEGVNEIMVFEQLCEANSKYAIDLWPKLIFSRSAAVDLLVSSGAHSYIHFTDTKGPMLYGYEPHEGEPITLYEVPNNKNAICRSKLLSPLEKRSLMLLISSLSELMFVPNFSSLSLRGGDAPENSTNASVLDALDDPECNWLEFLRSMGCNQNIVDLLSYGICLGGGDVTTWTKRHGLERMIKYVQSVGVWGDNEAPFLYPVYGTGDITQAFCRVGAVLGVTFMLGTAITSIGMDGNNRLNAIQLSNGMSVQTKLLLVDDEKVLPEGARMNCNTPNIAHENTAKYLHVVTIVFPHPILPDLNIAVINPKPANDQDSSKREPVYLLQTGCDQGVAPENTYVVYLMTIDEAAPARFASFAECQHQTVCRLMRCFNTMITQRGHRLEQTLLTLYTSHRVGSYVPDRVNNAEHHRGWLSKTYHNTDTKGTGVMFVPQAKATPVVPLIEELPEAVHLCDLLLGNPSKHLTAYMDAGLEGFLDVKRREEPQDCPTDSTAERLQDIINKYA